MRISAIFISFSWLALSIGWIINKPDYDSFGSALGAAIALFSSFFLKKEEGVASQSQHVSEKSVGIQAGRDVKVKNLNQK